MRVVLDVNVWISGWLWGGIPGQILMMAQNRQIDVFASEALIEELQSVLERAKLQSKVQSKGLTVQALISQTRQLAQLCATIALDVPQLRDPDDTIILAAAVAANAEAIVTGDLDLLTLTDFNGITILKPQDLLSHYFPNL